MDNFLQELKKKVLVGLVGGSDFVKIAEQMGNHDDRKFKDFSLFSVHEIDVV